MATALEALRRERQRKLQVREAFSRGIGHFREQGGDRLEFCLACAEYLVRGQRRLVDQDRRLVEILTPRVPAGQEQDHDAIAALRDRLDLADRKLADFELATADLRRRGAAGMHEFDTEALAFIDLLVNVLGARSHSLRHLTTTLLTEDDWCRIADITPEFTSWEEAKFQDIERLAPPGLAPGRMSIEPRTAGTNTTMR